MRSGDPNSQINPYLKRTGNRWFVNNPGEGFGVHKQRSFISIFIAGESEQSLCYAKGSGSFGDAVCLLMQRLNAGDQVCVKFAESGQIRLQKSYQIGQCIAVEN